MAADEVLTIGVDVDNRAAIQAMAKFQRDMAKQLQQVTKAVENMGKSNARVAEEATEDTKNWQKELGSLTKYYKAEVDQIKALEEALKKAEKEREQGDEKAQKDAEKRAKIIKKQLDDRKKALKAKALPGFDTKKMGDEAKGAMKEAGKSFVNILSSFFSKDLKGMLSGGGGVAVGLTRGIAKGLASGAGSLKGMGTALGRKGAAKGGAAGMGMRGMGAGLKAVGGLAGKMGGLVQTFAKLGPLLGMIGTGMMAVIKLLVDADAQAKGFQKDILQSASTVEILADSGWHAGAAYAELKDTLRGIRDAAFDAGTNLDWGISADTHKAVWNALNQEGVSLQRIREEAKAAGQDVNTFAKGMVGVSVAYSRAFGVPLQQINEQQAQLMTDMGASAGEVELAFSQMARAATDSGIAANKFYAIIRGVSQDLSLYNVRMGETVKLLKMLGKVMNPRNAQKFMQVATKGLKDMGRTERLKLTLLAGAGSVGKIVDRDMKRKTDLLAKKLKMDSAEVAKVMKTKGAKGLAKAIAQLPKEAQGAVTEMATKLQLQQTRRKKGVFGISGAAADVGPGAALDIVEKAVGRFANGKNLEDAVGDLGTEMIAEMLGISQEELDQRIQFKMAMDVEREKMIQLLSRQKELLDKEAKAGKGEIKLSQDEEEDIKRLHAMMDAGLTTADKVTKAGYDELFDAMTEGDQAAAKDAGKVVNYAKMQGSLTQSLLEKLGVLVDFVMNQLYNVMIDIWDAVGGDDLEVAAARSKNTAVMEAVQRAGGDEAKFRDEIAKAPVFQDMLKAMYITPDEIAKKQEKVRTLEQEARAQLRGKDVLSPEEKKQKLAEAAKLKAEVEADKKRSGAARGAVNKATKGYEGLVDKAVADAIGGGKLTGENWNKALQMKNLMVTGTGTAEAATQAGFTSEEAGAILGKMLHWGADPSKMAMAVGEYGKESGFTNKEMAEEAKKSAENIANEAKATSMEVEKQTKEMTSQSTVYFKFPNSWLRNEYKKAIEEAVLDAIRQGLFEYYMYSELDRESVVKAMAENQWTPKDFGKEVGEITAKGFMPGEALGIDTGAGDEEGGDGGTKKKEEKKKVPPKQHGGIATGISSEGLAIFRPAPGEGITGIAPGERIVPAYAGGGAPMGGGGATHVTIALAPSAQKLIQTEVQHGIYEHERRRKTAG